MNAGERKPLGPVHVDLGKGNQVILDRFFLCASCGKRLDQNTEVFGEYRKHNPRVGILQHQTCCSSCGYVSEYVSVFVRPTRYNGPVIEAMGVEGYIKPHLGKTGIRKWVSDVWYSATMRLGIERVG